MRYSIILMAISFMFSLSANAKEIHKERSIYRNVVITEKDQIRCMRFETRRKKVSNQTCIDLSDKQKLVFEYTQGILAGLAIQTKPSRVLILGLGGGTLSNTINQISPTTEIIAVDIDPVVVKLAKRYFDYKENEQVKTVIQDGRVYVKRALLKQEKFDWIILDAFNGDYIPEHMMTKEFLSEVKGLLTDEGIISANTFSSSELYHYESVTYQNVFNQLKIFKAPTKGNRVIFACNCDKLTFPGKIPLTLENHFSIYSMKYLNIVSQINDKVDWNLDSPMLTDQYSPANLLK